MRRSRARLLAPIVATLLFACAPRVPSSSSPPSSVSPTEAPLDEPPETAAADAHAPLPPPAPGELPEIRFRSLRDKSLADGVVRVSGYFLGPTSCPKGPPNAGRCAGRRIIAPRRRVPDGTVRAGELAVLATHDVTGNALVREPGERGIADLAPGQMYVLAIAVREVSGLRFFTLRGARIIP